MSIYKPEENFQFVQFQLAPQKLNINNLCRLCLFEGEVSDVFNTFYNNITFSELIEKLLLIEVNINDGLPKNICEVCIRNIVFVHNFQNKAQESYNFLRQLNPTHTNKVDEDVKSFDPIAFVKVENNGEEQDCNNSTKDEIIKSEQSEIQEVTDVEINKNNLTDPTYIWRADKTEFNCVICKNKFDTETILHEHIRCTHIFNGHFRCNNCGELFKTSPQLKKHMENTNHSYQQSFQTYVFQ